jgi:prepilin-type processing-associated H-X9-DG protein
LHPVVTDLMQPAMAFVMLDEQADSISDGAFMLDPGYALGQERWRDLPGSYHNNGCDITFADGHSEIHRWQPINDNPGFPKTVWPFTMINGNHPWKRKAGFSPDYEWMDDHMPCRQ